ncbi:MAG: IS1634 family transposase [Sphaerochaeta sp.]|nr:IS1634 family transposase [Sphaerochaeta sp.]
MQQFIDAEQVTLLSFKHYPMLRAFFEEHGLFQLFDTLLPKKVHPQLSHAHSILFLLCTCLTPRFQSRVTPDDLDLEIIFGPGPEAEDFTEVTMNETLLAIEEYGEGRLFSQVVSHLGQHVPLAWETLHRDTIYFSLAGEVDDGQAVHIKTVPAYENDSPWKLQVLSFLVNVHGFPLAIEVNQDSLTNSLLENTTFDSIFIRDSFFYTKKNIATFPKRWVSYVPEKLAHCLPTLEPLFVDSELEGYKVYGLDSSYGGVAQRWILVFSQKKYDRMEKTLQRNQEKQLLDAKARSRLLQEQTFASEEDALRAAKKLIARWPLLKVEVKITKTKLFSCSLTYGKDPLALGEACKKIGRYILATNDLSLGDDQVLQIYKNHKAVERGLRFLTSGNLTLTPLSQKQPECFGALGFVMSVSLLVYALLEKQVRASLAKRNETIHIQNGGPASFRDNANPTLRKIFTIFDNLGSTLLTMPGGEKLLIRSSLPPEVRKVLSLLGPVYEQAFTRSE